MDTSGSGKSSLMSSSHTTQSDPADRGRGKSRGKSRGGIGKYLRARGRRGYGRPAEFNKRLLLEGENPPDDDDEAEQIATENARKYSRRQLASNADRYEEPDPELGSDGELIVEPEVDLSIFLERQKLSDDTFVAVKDDSVDDDIDHDIAPLEISRTKPSRKGKVQQIEWTEEFEALHREKVAADAARDLKERFRASSAKLRTKKSVMAKVSPFPPAEDAGSPEPKDSMKEMEKFLDELLK